jgi:hypothetical protein
MSTDELENELRRAFARSAQGIGLPPQARQRLLQRDYHPRTGARRRAASLATAVAAVAAVTGLALTSLTGTGPVRKRPTHQPTLQLPSAASVGRAMLTAYQQASMAGDIISVRQAFAPHGRVLNVSQNWYWPLQPTPGQKVIERFFYAQRIPLSAKALTPLQDAVVVYRLPRDIDGLLIARARQTQVCYAQYRQTEYQGKGGCDYMSAQTPAGHWITPETRPGTWSAETFTADAGNDLSPGAGLNPATIAHDIITGQWKVVRRARMDGQPALELRDKHDGIPMASLWVSARTHLPLLNGPEQYAYLPPTPRNMALLRVHIPPGLPRSHPRTR